jgi:putative transposase
MNKSFAIKQEEKRLKRSQRALSRKLEFKRKRGEKSATGSGRK